MDNDILQRLLNQPIAPLSQILSKVPLKLNPRQENLTPRQKRLQDDIIAEVERECFTYESFHIELPESIASVSEAPSVAITGLFPKFQGWGDRRLPDDTAIGGKLSSDQLRDVARKGEFLVESAFPGLPHVWKVTKLVQEGRSVSVDNYISRLAWSLEQVLVRFPERLIHPTPCSVPRSLKSVWNGLRGMVDIFVGTSRYQYGALDPSFVEVWKAMVLEDPSRFQTSVNDLEILWEALPIVESIAKEVDDTVFTDEMSDLELSGGGNPSEPHPAMLNAAEMLFLSKLQSDGRLKSVSPTIGIQFSDLFLALMVTQAVASSVEQGLAHDKKSEREKLAKDHPVLERSDGWVTKKMNAWEKERAESRGDMDMWVAFDQIAEWLLKDASTDRELQLVEKSRDFLVNRKPTIKRSKKLQHLFTANFMIWRPKHWKIKSRTVNRQLEYYAIQSRSIDVNARLGWRWWAFACTTVSFMNNGLFFLIAVVMHLILRGLVSYDEFFPNTKVNRSTGRLEADLDVRVPTMMSRTRRLWQSARESRALFERAGDSGLLPRSSIRWLNRLWNYGVKFAIGTLLVWTIQPILTLLVVVISLALVVVSPVWALCCAALVFLYRIFISDYDGSWFLLLYHLVGEILIMGIGRFIVAVLGAVFHVFAMLLGVVFSALAFAMRRIWDGVMFHTLLKRMARIPAQDTFIARRIAGPGLATEVYYELDPSIALLSLFAYLETIELEHISRSVFEELEKAPQRFQQVYNDIVAPLFGPMIEARHAVPQFRRTTWKEGISREVENRRKVLERFLISDKQAASRIRFSAAGLSEVLQAGVVLVEAFYTRRVFPRVSDSPGDEEVFKKAGVLVNSWMELTKDILARVYHSNILEPIELVEKRLRLEISHVGLRNFGRMLIDGLPRDDLDKAKPNVAEILPGPGSQGKKPSVDKILPRVHAISATHFGEHQAIFKFPDIFGTTLLVPFLDFCSTRPSQFAAGSYILRDVVMTRLSPGSPSPGIRAGPTIKVKALVRRLDPGDLELELHDAGKLEVTSGSLLLPGYFTRVTGGGEGVRLVWKMSWSWWSYICVEGVMTHGLFDGKWESNDGKEWGSIEAIAGRKSDE